MLRTPSAVAHHVLCSVYRIFRRGSASALALMRIWIPVASCTRSSPCGETRHPHRFRHQHQDDLAKKIVDAVIAADKKDGLGYMEASPFEVGVRGGWRKAGPPHRQRMLRLSMANIGEQIRIFRILWSVCWCPAPW